MSYQRAGSLQWLIYRALAQAPSLSGIEIGESPPLERDGPFLLLGPEEVRAASDKSGQGATHRFQISVLSPSEGFLAAKIIAGNVEAVVTALRGNLRAGGQVEAADAADLCVVFIQFERALAKRMSAGAGRRIDLTFRARLDFQT